MPLPELIFDVLLSLPVKSLIRFRCLSKSICAEIGSAEFVNNHLKRSTENKTHQKLIINSADIDDFYSADFDDGLQEGTALCDLIKSHRNTTVCGCLNGLILLGMFFRPYGTDDYKTVEFVLWNPFTRRYKNAGTAGDRFIGCGLGYDSVLDDYKIVYISESWWYNNDYGVPFKVWIFSLKSNSWRMIQDAPRSFDDIDSIRSFRNGVLYWETHGSKVLGFDVANEVFFNLRLESDFDAAMNVGHDRMFLDGGLFVTRNCITHEFHYFCVNDKGGEEAGGSWRKTSIHIEGKEIFNFDLKPLTYSKDGDSILFSGTRWIFWYNPKTKTIQEVKIAGIPWNYWIPSYNICRESLVSLGVDSLFDETLWWTILSNK